MIKNHFDYKKISFLKFYKHTLQLLQSVLFILFVLYFHQLNLFPVPYFHVSHLIFQLSLSISRLCLQSVTLSSPLFNLLFTCLSHSLAFFDKFHQLLKLQIFLFYGFLVTCQCVFHLLKLHGDLFTVVILFPQVLIFLQQCTRLFCQLLTLFFILIVLFPYRLELFQVNLVSSLPL